MWGGIVFGESICTDDAGIFYGIFVQLVHVDVRISYSQKSVILVYIFQLHLLVYFFFDVMAVIIGEFLVIIICVISRIGYENNISK